MLQHIIRCYSLAQHQGGVSFHHALSKAQCIRCSHSASQIILSSHHHHHHRRILKHSPSITTYTALSWRYFSKINNTGIQRQGHLKAVKQTSRDKEVNDTEKIIITPVLDPRNAYERPYIHSEEYNLEEADSDELRQCHIDVIRMELEHCRARGVRAPSSVNEDNMQLILRLKTERARHKIYKFLHTVEMTKENDKRKKVKRQAVHEARLDAIKICRAEPDFEEPAHLLLKLRQSTMNTFYLGNLAFAMRFGQPLVFDMDFERHHKPKEMVSLLKQLCLCHHINKENVDPFSMVLCNVKPGGETNHRLDIAVSGHESTPGFTVTSKDYMDMFPHERLVYLTPNSPNKLKCFDHNDIYIIGGIVDLAQEVPLTLAKAKRQRIRSAKLPLDTYIAFEAKIMRFASIHPSRQN